MKEEQLVTLLEGALGPSKRARGGDEAVFKCPKCNHHKPKLTLNIHTQKFQCWVCGYKGARAIQLLKISKAPSSLFSKLADIDKQYNFKSLPKAQKKDGPQLPKEFIPLIRQSNSILRKKAISYLEKRGVTKQDMVKYNIGYVEEGELAEMVIIPSYDSNGFLNYWVGRSFESSAYFKHKLSPTSKDMVGFEMFINWDMPVIICEGAFDAIAIKRNAIPLFGKKINQQLYKKLLTASCKEVYLALDRDALKDAMRYAKELMGYGKKVYLLDLEEKDPSDIGFEDMQRVLESAKPLTYSSFIQKKILYQ